jgi:predicted SAM-dependent methyltransferase
LNKEILEQGDFPNECLRNDGMIKVNAGSFTSMAHWNWINLDIQPCHQFAQMNNYRFMQHDLRSGMPFNTAAVDLIFMHHTLEHFSQDEALKLLKDCRRVLKPEGALRLVVPDVEFLARSYLRNRGWRCENVDNRLDKNIDLKEFDEVNEPAATCNSVAGKFWHLVFPGHQMAMDDEILKNLLDESGFVPHLAAFRQTSVEPVRRILKECQESLPELSLFMDATPRMD